VRPSPNESGERIPRVHWDGFRDAQWLPALLSSYQHQAKARADEHHGQKTKLDNQSPVVGVRDTDYFILGHGEFCLAVR